MAERQKIREDFEVKWTRIGIFGYIITETNPYMKVGELFDTKSEMMDTLRYRIERSNATVVSIGENNNEVKSV